MARPQHSRLPPERAHLVLPRTSRRQHRCRAAPPAGRPAGAACLVCANWATWRRRRALSTRPATACAGGPARLRAPQVRGPPPAATFAGARGGRPTRGAGAGRAPAGVFFNEHLSTNKYIHAALTCGCGALAALPGTRHFIYHSGASLEQGSGPPGSRSC
jgi:hypothetical protein